MICYSFGLYEIYRMQEFKEVNQSMNVINVFVRHGFNAFELVSTSHKHNLIEMMEFFLGRPNLLSIIG